MYTVMFVDDESRDLGPTKAYLEMTKEMHVKLIADPDIALAEARRLKPDLFLIDLYMPPSGGDGLGDAIRHDPELKDKPIIFITGKLATPPEQYANRENEWLVTKDIAPSALRGMILDILRGKATR